MAYPPREGGVMNASTAGREGDFDAICAELRARAEGVRGNARRAQPQAVQQARDALGHQGQHALALSGTKRGSFFDHEANEGGDLLWLIRRRETGDDFPEAVSWARGFLGIPEPLSRPDTDAKRAAREASARRRRRSARKSRRNRKRSRRPTRRGASPRPGMGRRNRCRRMARPRTHTDKVAAHPTPGRRLADAVRYHRVPARLVGGRHRRRWRCAARCSSSTLRPTRGSWRRRRRRRAGCPAPR